MPGMEEFGVLNPALFPAVVFALIPAAA